MPAMSSLHEIIETPVMHPDIKFQGSTFRYAGTYQKEDKKTRNGFRTTSYAYIDKLKLWNRQ
jgi:hypothetical protein